MFYKTALRFVLFLLSAFFLLLLFQLFPALFSLLPRFFFFLLFLALVFSVASGSSFLLFLALVFLLPPVLLFCYFWLWFFCCLRFFFFFAISSSGFSVITVLVSDASSGFVFSAFSSSFLYSSSCFSPFIIFETSTLNFDAFLSPFLKYKI